MIRSLKCLIVLFLVNFSFSQNKKYSLLDSVQKYYYTDYFKSKFFAKKLEKKLLITSDNKFKIINYCYLADLSSSLNHKDSVLYFYDKATEIALSSNEKENLLYVNINKANYYNANNDFDSSLSIYDKTLKIAESLDDNFIISHIQMQKGYIFYELEKYDESIVCFQKSLTFTSLNPKDILNNKIGIIKCFLKQRKLKEANVLIEESLKIKNKTGINDFEIILLTQKAIFFKIQKDYKRSIEIINSAIKIASANIEHIEMPNLLFQKAQILTLNGENNESVQVLNEIINKYSNKLKTEEFCEIYYVLSENYKNLGDLANSNKYLNLYLDYSKKIGQKKIDTLDYLHKIDLSEIQNKQHELYYQNWILVLVIGLLLIGILLFFWRKKKKDKENQTIFDNLMQKITEYEENNTKTFDNESFELTTQHHLNSNLSSNVDFVDLFDEDVVSDTENLKSSTIDLLDEINSEKEDSEDFVESNGDFKNTAFIIKDETINEILEKLIKLEDKKQFLKQDFTLHNVAKKLKTNTAYLSKIINNELGKSFSAYANELRINYIILELKNNSKLRSYSISAISEEIGYKSPESFTKYFKIATGLSPSTYIKKINKTNQNIL